MSHTWTEHTFRCETCRRLARASRESIDDAVRDCGYEGEEANDDVVVMGFSFCLHCIDGDDLAYEGEHVAECEGAQNADNTPACNSGKHPKRYWFHTNLPGAVWQTTIWCHDCENEAIVNSGCYVVRADSPIAPTPDKLGKFVKPNNRTMDNADFDAVSAWAEQRLPKGTCDKEFDSMLATWKDLDDDDRDRVRGHGWHHLAELAAVGWTSRKA